MESDIQVSVLCLAYNHAKYIRECLDGFVMQKTNFRFEVLIHDDASTDGTAEIIKEYEARYPELIMPIYQSVNQHSQGVKINATYQYPRARGKYIAFCEGDDCWIDELKLQKQFEALESHPECSACFHVVQCVDENGVPDGGFFPEEYEQVSQGVISNKDYLDMLWYRPYAFQTSSYFFRLDDVLTNYQIFDYANSGDTSYLRVASLNQKCVFFYSGIMSLYRRHMNGSWTSRFFALKTPARVAWEEKRINGALEFDKHTNGIYHRHILRYAVVGLACMAMLDPKATRKLIVDNHIPVFNWGKSVDKTGMRWKQSCLITLRLVLCKYVWWCVKPLFKMKRCFSGLFRGEK